MTAAPDQTTAAAPWTLHAICELTRLAACGYCPAAGVFTNGTLIYDQPTGGTA